ncbi:MAG: hypothetical protein MI923_30960, partial [Phycisphaerales bacterium]|nr:hypothetical protein [Phycisphaerales bacterium]
SVGHLNDILVQVGGNLNKKFQKSQMPGGLPGGGLLKLRFDRYIIYYKLHSKCDYLYILIGVEPYRNRCHMGLPPSAPFTTWFATDFQRKGGLLAY